jgi:hypothetical protein
MEPVVRTDPARALGEAGRPTRRTEAGDRQGLAGPGNDEITPDSGPDELLPDVWFISHPSARRKKAA